ncbi:hypothetical protein GF373_09295 [bacterium]|nr:hypothetical protein [bacterium]
MAIFEFFSPFFIILIGFIFARILSKIEDHSISCVCFFIFLPAFLFRQSMSQDLFSNQFFLILFFGVFHCAIQYLLASGIFRLFDVPSRTRRLFILISLTVSIVTFQKIRPMLGEPGNALETIRILTFHHLVFLAFIGVYLGAGKERVNENLFQVFKTPLTYFIVFGLILAGMQVSLPYELLEFIDSFHTITLPLALLLLGIMLGKYIFFFQFRDYSVLYAAAIVCMLLRLIVSPALAMLITQLMGFDNVELQRALILTAGAPTGILAAVVVGVYGRSNEKRFTVLCIALTTLVSFITIPLLKLCVDYLFPLDIPTKL